MEKQKFTFINEGNGIEGLIASGIILDIEKSATPKVAIKDKNSNLVWDPVFECFIKKEDDKDYTLEKATVAVKRK